jgi:hypothetical protein
MLSRRKQPQQEEREMKIANIETLCRAEPGTVFEAKVKGVLKHVLFEDWTKSMSEVVVVVVECPYGESGNYDLVRKEEVVLPTRNILKVAYNSLALFRQDAMAKDAAAAFDKMNY